MKKLIAAAVILGGGGAVIGVVLLALTAALFSGSGTDQQGCTSSIDLVDASGPVRMPIVGTYTVTSEYGMRYNPGGIGHGIYRLHAGIDLAMTPQAGPVVAATSGVVQATPTTLTEGNAVVIGAGAGLDLTYMHLASRTVQVGDRVWPGRQIGVEGSTGNSSGPHLHFQVKVNGTAVDPRDWLTQHGLVVPPTGGSGAAPGVADDPGAGGDVPVVLAAASSTSSTSPASTPAATASSGQTRPIAADLPTQVGPYRGEQVRNAALIIRAGQALHLDARTITIGVMTAMGESSLLVVDHGDGAGPDSRGLFQQRANGAWGSDADRMDPVTSATNFFKALTAVPDYRALEPTIAAHRTQANADPYHYAPYWAAAAQMVATLTKDPDLLTSLPAAGPLGGCGNAGPTSTPAAGDGSGAAIVAAARHYLGTAYAWGGGDVNGPSSGSSTVNGGGGRLVGFDCSGLVLFAVHSAVGIQLPHSAEDQGQGPQGSAVPRDWTKMQPGDVIAFSEDGSGAPGSYGHVGIYIGDGQMIHAPRPGKSVQIVQLQGSRYYEPMAWAIRRYARTNQS